MKNSALLKTVVPGKWLRLACVGFVGLLSASLSPMLMAQTSVSRSSIEAYGEGFTSALAAPAQQARIFVYRAQQGLSQLPVNIYLNGQYHASLLRGGYTEFCTSGGSLGVKGAIDDAARLHVGKLDAGQRLTIQAGQSVFLKVDETALPAVTLQSLPPPQAQTDMANTKRQIHTISRAKAAQACAEPAGQPPVVQPPVVAAARPEVPREYALETDALFEFGKAEMRASGFNAIENLVQRLRQDYTSVDRIRVVGYTDPIGSAAFNRKLSQERAEVVASQIATRNVKPNRGIDTEGRGSIELAKTGCGNTATPENKICHAPNRRVVVVVTGARR
jgi:OOP family OmpA-OmpF porin